MKKEIIKLIETEKEKHKQKLSEAMLSKDDYAMMVWSARIDEQRSLLKKIAELK